MAADGTRVHGEYFTHLFYGTPWVRRFQLIQEATDRLVLRIVKDPAAAAASVAADMERVLRETQRVMGEEYQVEVRFVSEILPCRPANTASRSLD